MLVPVRADTGMLPQTLLPVTCTFEASTHAVPLQYSIVVPEFAWESEMQIWAVPSVIPVTLTS